MSVTRVWVIQKKHKNIGDLHACLGVAARLCDDPEIHYVEDIEAQGGPTSWLKKQCAAQHMRPRDFLPDVIISSHNISTSIPYVTQFKKLSGGKTFLLQLRDPGQQYGEFDLIANPSYAAKIVGPNIMETTGIAHNITHPSLKTGREVWRDELSAFDTYEKIAVMVGGNVPNIANETGGGAFTVEDATQLGKELNRFLLGRGASLFLINSHRTPEDAWRALRMEMTDVPAFVHDYRFDAAKGNPYHGLLQAADILIPTADSMSMCSECCFTGKPVYLAGRHFSNVRSDHLRLADQLMNLGHARCISDIEMEWPTRPKPLDAAGDIAAEAQRRIQMKRSILRS